MRKKLALPRQVLAAAQRERAVRRDNILQREGLRSFAVRITTYDVHKP